MKLKIHFNHKEELWNSWSHAGGILLGVVFGAIFLYWCFTQHNGYWGWSLFIFIWTCAIAGTVMSFAKLKDHSNLETICFVGMGLSVLVAFKPLIDSVSPATVIWIIAEGVCYITGAVFYSINKKRYMHSVFHFFVLAGSVCHIIAVWDILMKYI